MRTQLIVFLVRLLGRLPVPLLRAIGWLLGALAALLPNRERHVAEVNLQLCFPTLPAASRRRLLRRSLREAAVTLCEMPSVWARGIAPWRRHMTLPGEVADRVLPLLERGKGLIVAAPHLGNWELGLHYFDGLAPVTALYRPPRLRALEPILLRGRERDGARLAPTSARGIRMLYQALQRGEIVVILPDQQPPRAGTAGVFAPFFGQPALTMTLLSRLAARSGAPVVFGCAVRDRHGRYRPHLVLGDDDIAASDPVRAAAALNRGVQRCVEHYPEQYQWTYRRFRLQPGDAANPYRLARQRRAAA